MATNVQMQARSSSDGELYYWVTSSPDFAGASFPGPGSPEEIAVVAKAEGGAGGGGGLTAPASPAEDGFPAVAQSGDLVYQLLTNAHIAAAAGIAVTKFAAGSAHQVAKTNAAGDGVEWGLLTGNNIANASIGAGKLASDVTLAAVLNNGADAADIGITNLGGASVTSGQALTFLGEIDIRNATPRLYTLGGNTRIEAPAGQVVQAVVDGDRIANWYKDLVADGGSSDLFGMSLNGSLGGTSVIYGDAAPAGVNGPDMLIKGHDGGDDGSTATAGGDILWRPGGPKQGGAGGRVVMQGHNATDLLAASVAGGLEASAQLTLTLTAIAAAQTPGATLENTTAATAGTPQQYSPMQGFVAHGWDGSAADVTIESAWQLQPLGTDTGGTSHHKLLTRTGGSGAWQEVGRFAFEAGDPTTEPAFLLNGSVNSHVRFGAVDVNSSQPAPGSWLQGSLNSGAGDDGDAGVRSADGTARIYHDASEGVDKMGDHSGGAVLDTTATAVQVFVPSLEFGASVSNPTIQQAAVADAAGSTTTLAGQENNSLASKAGGVLVQAGFNANMGGESGDLELRVQSSFADAGEIGKLTVHDPNDATVTKLAWNEHTVAFNGVTPSSGMVHSYTFTNDNWVATRAFDADNTTLAELADVLSTLIADLGGAGGSQTTGGYGLFITDPAA